MSEEQREILSDINSGVDKLIAISKDFTPDFYAFERIYEQLKLDLQRYIDAESNEEKIKSYGFQYRIIEEYERRPKGVSSLKEAYRKTLKARVSRRSVQEYEALIIAVAKHIRYDIENFQQIISLNESDHEDI